MKTIPVLAIALLVTTTLAACSSGHSFSQGFDHGFVHGWNANIDHSVRFEHGELVLHAPHSPDAYIDADGKLRIGKRAIAVTPQQRTLLKGYYSESQAFVNDSETTGNAGAELGLHAVGHAIKSIFSGDSNQSDQKLKAQANAVAASARKLCHNIQTLHATGQAIAAQLPAFKPYDAVGDTHCVITTSTTNTTTLTINPAGPTKVIESASQGTGH